MNLTFLNAGFLFAAVAALIPLVIHLISRRKVETVDFSSLRFLKELERKRIRRVRLRQILLLIVRGLILLCAALALARPTLRGVQAGGAHARTSVAVVLDDSASMSRERDGRPLFADAVAAARGIAGLLSEGDQAFLITAGVPPRSVIPGGTFSPDALGNALGGLTVGAAATDYPAALALARDLLAGARNLNREIYVVGDMQRTGWRGGRALEAGGIRSEPGGAATAGTAGPRTYCLEIPGPEGNLSVSVVDVARQYGGTPGLHSVSAEVRNHGRRAATVPVRLFLGAEQVGQAGVEVEAGATASARFAFAVDESRWHSGRVEIPADALAPDNTSYLAIPASRRTEVLVVVPDGAEGARGDGSYVRRALDPTGGGERFSPASVPVSSLASQDRGRFPVVVLADAGRLSGPAVEWLERHLADGGGALVILGKRTDVRSWNEGPLSPLTGVILRAPFERSAGVRIAPAAQGHPLLDGLVLGARLIDEVVVRRGFETEPGGAEEVLEAPGVGPVLVMTPDASGRAGGATAVLLTGIDPAWSDLPTSGLIVPLLHRLVERLGARVARAEAVLVGDDLRVPLAASAGGSVEVELPGGASLTAPVAESGGAPVAVLERAPSPGVYRFVDGGGAGGALAVVNPVPAESDLKPASDDEIATVAPGVRRITAGAALEDEILEARRGRELWRAFLYAALALLALEMVAARPRGTSA
jgi:hypothetical protein